MLPTCLLFIVNKFGFLSLRIMNLIDYENVFLHHSQSLNPIISNIADSSDPKKDTEILLSQIPPQ